MTDYQDLDDVLAQLARRVMDDETQHPPTKALPVPTKAMRRTFA